MTMTKRPNNRDEKPPQEPGYRAVLCHETVKARLSDVRNTLPDETFAKRGDW